MWPFPTFLLFSLIEKGLCELLATPNSSVYAAPPFQSKLHLDRKTIPPHYEITHPAPVLGVRGAFFFTEALAPNQRVTYRPDSCSLLELLAVVIGGPRQIEIAHDMLDHFGTIVAISRASENELSKIDGVGSVIAARLRAILGLSRRLLSVPPRSSPQVQTPDDAAQLLIHRVQDLEQEVFIVLLLDTRNRLIGEPIEVYRGTLNSTHIRIWKSCDQLFG
jgi:hypothetical protein